MTESGLNILVVDDDMLARMTAAQCLKREGHTASMAYGGERALEMLNSGNYDLVLLDLLMPDIDGLEVLRHIKEDPGSILSPLSWCLATRRRRPSRGVIRWVQPATYRNRSTRPSWQPA